MIAQARTFNKWASKPRGWVIGDPDENGLRRYNKIRAAADPLLAVPLRYAAESPLTQPPPTAHARGSLISYSDAHTQGWREGAATAPVTLAKTAPPPPPAAPPAAPQSPAAPSPPPTTIRYVVLSDEYPASSSPLPSGMTTLSLCDASALAAVSHSTVQQVLKTMLRIYSLAQKCEDANNGEEVYDALCFDPGDVDRLQLLLERLYTQIQRGSEWGEVGGVGKVDKVGFRSPLPDGVFLMLGFLIFFATFKFEQTGVDVNVQDAFRSIDRHDRVGVSLKFFISLFFRYGTSSDVVCILNK